MSASPVTPLPPAFTRSALPTPADTADAAPVLIPIKPRHGPLLDAGWLFLVAGVAIIAATVLIPAQNDLDDARFYLKRAQTAEEHRLARMSNYAAYLSLLQQEDEATVRSLAASQLNKAPEGLTLLTAATDRPEVGADVFMDLEPPALVLPEKPTHEPSRLETWATGETSRLWLMAGGVMCILFGLMPPTIVRR
ncbi:MAG: hypothetical protein ACT4PL_12315 [Phycisphaerales bacterium]